MYTSVLTIFNLDPSSNIYEYGVTKPATNCLLSLLKLIFKHTIYKVHLKYKIKNQISNLSYI